MRPRFDGYYRSDRQRREEWHAGVHIVEGYFEYLKLFEGGSWLRKTHPTSDLDFPVYLGGITKQSLWDGLAERDLFDAEYNFLHQTGQFTQRGDRLEFLFRHFLVVMHEPRWELRVESPERLVSESGAVYAFLPMGPA
jgi:hypothetical protein